MTRTPDSPERSSTLFGMFRGNPKGMAILDSSFAVLIVLNVVAVILESVESIDRELQPFFRAFNLFSVAVFTIEYLLRLWFAPHHVRAHYRSPVRGRLRYALSPLAIIDLLAFLPYYLSFVIAVDLRFLRVLRLVRMFKLTRYSAAMTILLRVLHEERASFGAALFILVVILIVAASGIYLVEHEAQPEAFGSIPAAMWWAVATLTTVGYGDVTPMTAGGKLFGALVTIVGIGMVALPAGILASAFSDQLRRRREEYRELVQSALRDGKLTAAERQELSQKCEDLGLDPSEAERLQSQAGPESGAVPSLCPHCGGVIQGGISPPAT